MRTTRFALDLLTACAITALACNHISRSIVQSANDDPGAPAEEAALRFAGGSAVECGRAPPEGDSKVDACVLEAFAAKKPFVALFAWRGIDSACGETIAADRSGALRQFHFDSYRSDREHTVASLDQTDCVDPHAETTGGRRWLACAGDVDHTSPRPTANDVYK